MLWQIKALYAGPRAASNSGGRGGGRAAGQVLETGVRVLLEECLATCVSVGRSVVRRRTPSLSHPGAPKLQISGCRTRSEQQSASPPATGYNNDGPEAARLVRREPRHKGAEGKYSFR